MMQFSEFALRFIQSLNQVSESSRVFLFSESMVEADPFSLQTLGEQLNYNKNYLCSVFRKDTGISIVEYLNFIRIRQAIIFFAFYGQDVHTTCESVGFANLSHFSRTFKALVGVPPRDFRRAFSLLSQEDAARYFADERVLNYQICTMEEAMTSLHRSGQIALQILQTE